MRSSRVLMALALGGFSVLVGAYLVWFAVTWSAPSAPGDASALRTPALVTLAACGVLALMLIPLARRQGSREIDAARDAPRR